MFALLAMINTGQVGFTDEGIYSAQVDNLARGGWARPLVATELDPDGSGVVATGSTIVDGEYIPYARHALYPVLLLLPYRIAGQVGMLAVSVLGTVAAALAASLLARRLSPNLAVPTLWLTGVASPLLFGAFLVIAHSVAAAVTGFMVLAATRAVDDRRWQWLALTMPLAAVLTALRSEGLLVVAALAGMLLLGSLSPRPPLVRQAGGLIAALALVGVGLGTYLVNLRITAAITGEGGSPPALDARDPDAVSSAWVSLVRPWSGDGTNATPTSVLMILCVVLAALTYRLLPRFRLLSVGLVVLAAAASLPLLFREPQLISGLLPAFPLVVLGLGLLSWRQLSDRLAVRLVGTSVLVTAGILATVYAEGGATEWGGRFFYVLIPLLTPVAAWGLSNAREGLPHIELRTAAAAALLLTMVLSVTAVRTNRTYRIAARNVVDTTMEFASRPADVPVIVATLSASGSARIFWRELGRGKPVVNATSVGGLHSMIERSDSAGLTQVVVATNVDADLLAALTRSTLQEVDWSVVDSVRVPNSSFYAVRLGAN